MAIAIQMDFNGGTLAQYDEVVKWHPRVTVSKDISRETEMVRRRPEHIGIEIWEPSVATLPTLPSRNWRASSLPEMRYPSAV